MAEWVDPNRPPRKYADKERTRLTPEWTAWRESIEHQAEDSGFAKLATVGFDPTMYLPGDNAIPPEGAWILILEEPHTVLRASFRLPLLSMWRARPHELNSGGVEIAKGVKVYPQQAVISTPAGDLHLWSHEYVICSNPRGLIGDPDATLNHLGGRPVVDEEHLFYLMSRGIPHSEAVLLLFDQIATPDFVYVTFPDEVTAELEGVGRSLRRHVAMNPRSV